MTKALVTKDIEAHKKKLEDYRKKREPELEFEEKKFDELSNEEKDQLLKLTAIKLGLIKE